MNDSWQKQKDEFNRLCGLWDDAQSKGIFKSKPVDDSPKSDFFGNYNVEEKPLNDDDATYWSDIVSRSGEMFPDETTILMEAAKKKEEKLPKKTGDKVSKKDGQYQVDGGKPLNDLVKTSLENAGKLSKKDKAKKLANNPNPVYPDTVGPDTVDKQNRVRVTAGLAAHPLFGKLEKLKRDLYDLEVKMSGANGFDDKKSKSLEKQFNSLRNQIEKLSNQMGGDYKSASYYQ